LGQINTCRIFFTLTQRKSASKSKKRICVPPGCRAGFEKTVFNLDFVIRIIIEERLIINHFEKLRIGETDGPECDKKHFHPGIL